MEATSTNRTGVHPSLNLAGILRRTNAFLIDLSLITILLLLLKIAFPDFSSIFFKKSTPFMLNGTRNWELNKTSSFAAWILYCIIMESTSLQGTVGKQWMGIIATDENGKRLTVLQSLRRNLWKILSFMVAGLGFLNAFVDKKQRGWHDLLAKTRVITKNKSFW